jgi:hypothetical protein
MHLVDSHQRRQPRLRHPSCRRNQYLLPIWSSVACRVFVDRLSSVIPTGLDEEGLEAKSDDTFEAVCI